MSLRARNFLLCAVGLSLGACGKRSDVGVKVAFLNISSRLAQQHNLLSTQDSVFHLAHSSLYQTQATPAQLAIKIVSIYITPDINNDGTSVNLDGTTAATQAVWAAEKCFTETSETQNAQCRDSDGQCLNLPLCDIETGGTVTQRVENYFDLASSQLNSEFNSPGLSLSPGSYKYLRFAFAGANGGVGSGDQVIDGVTYTAGDVPTIKYSHPAMNGGAAAEYRVINGKDIPLSTDNSGINFQKGDKVSITLEYSLDNTLFFNDNGFASGDDECTQFTYGSTGHACVSIPEFLPVIKTD